MTVRPTISIVIGSFNRKRFIRLTIESVRAELKRCSLTAEIIVVDGGSTDGSLAWLVKQKDIITIVQHNRGDWQGRPLVRRSWGYFMNLGFKSAQGLYICMLSDDCLVVPGAIENGVQLFRQMQSGGEKTGAIPFFWRNWPEQQKYWVGVTFGSTLFVNHGLYLRQAVEEVGYLDEEAYTFYHADGDLCLRLVEKGYSIIPSADSFIEHYSHANEAIREENLKLQHRDWLAYQSKWGHLGIPEHDWIECEFSDTGNTVQQFSKWRFFR